MRKASRGQDPLAGRDFPRRSTLELPTETAGWEQLYAYSLPFSDDGHEEDQAFWFRDAIHWPRVVTPFESAITQFAIASLGQFNHRHFLIPSAKGLGLRILGGYCYLSPESINDATVVAERSIEFASRAGYYYEHWDTLYEQWRAKVRDLIDEMESVQFSPLPAAVSIDDVCSGNGLGLAYRVPSQFHALMDAVNRLWQYHFEMLNLGYARYLDFFEYCKSLLPDIEDLSVARMVAGIEVDLYRPDRELRSLARLALELGVHEELKHAPPTEAIATFRALAEVGDSSASQWIGAFDRATHDWFNFSTGSGFHHDDPVWFDRLDIPISLLRNYIHQIEVGHEIDTPQDRVVHERDEIVERCLQQIAPAHHEDFSDKLDAVRSVFHYVENHNFYVEHWAMSIFWRKLRQLSELFVSEAFWPEVDDMFMLRVEEIDSALSDLVFAWASGRPARGPEHWPAEIIRRRRILDACAAWEPPLAIGTPPDQFTEPFTVMLWGITASSIAASFAEVEEHPTRLQGLGVSSGVVEGRVCVVTDAEHFDDIADGDIIVAEQTSPSWTPVFARAGGSISEAGGLMSHTAIVCREYGLPAITGVAHATRLLHTGQLVRLDGDTGTIDVLG